METLVWTQGSDGSSAEKVVADFARGNWDRPRKGTPLRDGRFRITDSIHEYRITLEPGGIWAIYREDLRGDDDPHPLD